MEINWTYILWSALACLIIAIVFLNKHAVGLPIINDYPWDFLRKRARSEYLYNSRGLIAEGLKKFHGPFQLVTTQGTRVILPSEYTDWAKNSRDLDHQALVLDDYFADYPGFDGNAVVVNPNRMLINVTKSKLSQNSGSIKIMSEQLDDVLKTTWTESKDWHSINWSEDTVHFISRMATSIFSGEELATNEEWQEIMITYTINLFQGVGALRSWPALLRPLAHRFLPYSKICMQQVKRTRTIVANHLEERNREKQAAIAEGIDPPVYEDIFTWMEEAANGAPVDHAAVQLAFAISALHTTTEALRQILLDICLHPDIIEPLREEIEVAMNEHGPTISGLFKMQLLDSVMKESQRMKAPPVGIERRAVRATVLPDGTAIPYGTVIAVDASDMWSTEYHIDPEIYDGYRFLRLRETGGKHTATSAFVSSTKEHNIFGGGRSICPGRFFAANEIKLALAHILLKYDIRLKDGSKLKDIHYGFYRPTDMQAEVEVRRRDGGDVNVFKVKVEITQIEYSEFSTPYTPLQLDSPLPSITGASDGLKATLNGLDPRVSEYVLQFPFFAKVVHLDLEKPELRGHGRSQVEVFLPFLLDYPARTSAWEMSTTERQLSYGLLNLVVPEDERVLTVLEHRRLQSTGRGREWQLPTAEQLQEACRELLSLLAKLRERGVTMAPTTVWRTVGVYQDLKWASSLGKTSLSATLIEKARVVPLQRVSWDVIHASAQLHGSFYSFRILQQCLSIIHTLLPSTNLPDYVHKLHEEFRYLPKLSELPPIEDVMAWLASEEAYKSLQFARSTLGIEKPTVEPSRESKATKKKRKREAAAQSDHASTKRPVNIFEVLGTE